MIKTANSNKIETPRGTSLKFSAPAPDGYERNENDIARFGVKRTENSNDFEIEKEITEYDAETNCYIVRLTPEDTNIETGRYWYDVGLQTADGSYYMLVKANRFNITSAITKKVVTE